MNETKTSDEQPSRTETVEIAIQGDLFAAFQQLMTTILASSEDVGKNFSLEARRIHNLEAQQRVIRGEASFEDYETLREEGVEVLLIPSIRKEDFN